MVPILRSIAILIGWYALTGSIGLFYVVSGGGEYMSPHVLMESLSVFIQLSVIVLIIFRAGAVLKMFGFEDDSSHLYRDIALLSALVILPSLYMIIEGLTYAASAYVSARIEFAASGISYGSLFTSDIFDWSWDKLIYGIAQALVSGAVFVTMLIHNRALKTLLNSEQEKEVLK